MKEKIETALKTKYSNLGFDATVIASVAEYLSKSAKSDEEIDQAVSGVEPLLKVYQSSFDKARGERVKQEKEIEELKAKLTEKPSEPAKQEPPKNDYEARFAMMEKMFEEKLGATQDELAQYKSAAEQAKRNAFINSKAIELGIPQSFIDRGLGVSNEADEESIVKHISGFAEDLAKERENTIGRFQVPRKKELSLEDGQEILKRLKV